MWKVRYDPPASPQHYPCMTTHFHLTHCIVACSIFLNSFETTDTLPVTTAAVPDGKCLWGHIHQTAECHVSGGEVYLENSPGKVASLDQCKKSCENAAGCQSITYFNSGWCSHFSTPCTKTKLNNKAVALACGGSGKSLYHRTTIRTRLHVQALASNT